MRVKEFILKLVVLSIFVGGFIAYLLLTKANGNLDPYYARFTSPPAHSLILGTSRAAQGIQPTVLNEHLEGKGFELPVLNFGFTLIHSSFGETYLNSIKKKINSNTKKGIFILAIDPWSISSTSKEDNELEFLERNTFMAELKNVSSKPNFDYLKNHYEGPYFLAFKKRATFLHEDGWLEVNIPMDTTSIKRRVQAKVKEYARNAKNYSFSQKRFEKLKETILFLKKHGDVFLVRLPVAPEIKLIEDQYIPDFNIKIKEVTNKLNLPYLNLINESGKYQTTDGNHLHRESGKKVTKEIADFILNYKKTK